MEWWNSLGVLVWEYPQGLDRCMNNRISLWREAISRSEVVIQRKIGPLKDSRKLLGFVPSCKPRIFSAVRFRLVHQTAVGAGIA